MYIYIYIERERGREDPHGARTEVREAPPAALHAGGAETAKL